MENYKNKIIKKNIIITIQLFIIIGLGFVIYTLYNSNITLKNKNKKLTSAAAFTEKEAKKIGKELYDKATEIYSFYNKELPYCGISIKDIENKERTLFEKELASDSTLENSLEKVEVIDNKTYYYKSNYNSLEDLKDYLKNYLSEDLVDKNITEKPVKDLVMLKNEAYSGSKYVEYKKSLYCKIDNNLDSDSRYISNYSKDIEPYSFKIVTKDENKVTYLIKSKYLSNKVTNFETECKEDINKCIETREKQFTIEKIDGKWVVTVFTMHE